jgi:hypothetical protein
MQALAPANPEVPIADEAGAAVPVTVNVRMSPVVEAGMRLPNPFPKFTSVQLAGTISLAVSEQVMPVGVNQVGTSPSRAVLVGWYVFTSGKSPSWSGGDTELRGIGESSLEDSIVEPGTLQPRQDLLTHAAAIESDASQSSARHRLAWRIE